MANQFKRFIGDLTGTAANTEVLVYNVPDDTAAVLIGALASNLANTQVESTVRIDNDGGGANGEVYLGKDLPILTGSSLEFMEAKHVLQGNDSVIVLCDTANSMTFLLSVLEIT